MGALKGSISYAKFYVRGELPDDFRDAFVENIRLRAFRPLVAEEEDESRVGWCSIEHPFDLDLDHNKIYFNSYLNLGLRIDRWAIPKPLFKAHFEEAERELLAKRGREKLGKKDKEDLKERVERRLRKQLIPTMKVIDLSWNLDTGVLRFWNQSNKVHEQLHAIFEDTFDLDLVPESPYTAAVQLGMEGLHAKAFEAAEPTIFAAARH